jgi:hypothetical protein
MAQTDSAQPHQGRGPSPLPGKAPTAEAWFAFPETCTHCGAGDSVEDSARMLVLCSCCYAHGVHVGCYQAATGKAMDREITHGDGLYMCSEVRVGRRAGVQAAEAQLTWPQEACMSRRIALGTRSSGIRADLDRGTACTCFARRIRRPAQRSTPALKPPSAVRQCAANRSSTPSSCCRAGSTGTEAGVSEPPKPFVGREARHCKALA